MILLDSDHLTVLKFRSSPRSIRLSERLAKASDQGPVGTTIVCVEESMRGWMAAIAKEKLFERQVFAYRELAELFQFFSGLHIALVDEDATREFGSLRSAKIRVRTMDLKIASIALARKALLLTANRRDFEQVPGLRMENWLD
jgi:tRNA(fMet)-specific endonuclease VapC